MPFSRAEKKFPPYSEFFSIVVFAFRSLAFFTSLVYNLNYENLEVRFYFFVYVYIDVLLKNNRLRRRQLVNARIQFSCRRCASSLC